MKFRIIIYSAFILALGLSVLANTGNNPINTLFRKNGNFRIRLQYGGIHLQENEWPLVQKDKYLGKSGKKYFLLLPSKTKYVKSHTGNIFKVSAENKYGKLDRELVFDSSNIFTFRVSYQPFARFARINEFICKLELAPEFFYEIKDDGLNVEFHGNGKSEKRSFSSFNGKNKVFGQANWDKAVITWHEGNIAKTLEIIPDFSSLPFDAIFYDRRKCGDHCYQLCFILKNTDNKKNLEKIDISVKFILSTGK